MAYTLSLTIGKHHNLKHNLDPEYRATLKPEQGYNIHPELSHLNINTCSPGINPGGTDNNIIKQTLKHHTQLKQDLEQAIEQYNHGKRKDRQLTMQDLYNPKKKQHLEIYEAIIQVGNEDNHPTNRKETNRLLYNMIKKIKKQTPGLIPISFSIHWDEGTPHAHFDFIIINRNPERKRGLKYDFSLDTATGGGRENFMLYRSKLESELIQTAREHGLEIDQPHRHLKHRDTKLYNMEKQLLEHRRGATPSTDPEGRGNATPTPTPGSRF